MKPVSYLLDSHWITLSINGSLDVPLAMNTLGMAHAWVLGPALPGQGVFACASPMACVAAWSCPH